MAPSRPSRPDPEPAGASGRRLRLGGLTIRYRLAFLHKLTLLLALPTIAASTALMVADPDELDVHDLLGPFAMLPPGVRGAAMALLGTVCCAVLLLILVRGQDDRDDVVIDRRGISDIGLLSRRFVAWDDVSHVVIARRRRSWPNPWGRWMHIYLEPGSSLQVDEVVPGITLHHRLGRPRLMIPLAVCDKSEKDILAVIKSFRPGLAVHDL